MRGRIFYPKDQVNKCKEFPAKSTSSTLLIPARNIEMYLARLEDFENNPTDYLTYLLKSYGFLIRNGILAKNAKLETAYQEEGLNLQRVDFVPKGEDWAENFFESEYDLDLRSTFTSRLIRNCQTSS